MNPSSLPTLEIIGSLIKDDRGRTLQLRGVNLSGESKLPRYPDIPSNKLEQFYESADSVSFLDRPFSLKEADTHLQRLKDWGFTILRYVITWEAIEHEGPGKYDDQFIEFSIKVLRKCKEFGFRVFIDPHQDVWSRFCSGSGAPFWTLIAAGMNPINFPKTCAALVHCAYPSLQDSRPEEFPSMIWSTNYHRLASQTMFTLFFAGKKFAPECILDGLNIQEYLQRHFIKSFVRLAQQIHQAGDLEDCTVIGYDTINEPSNGFIHIPDISKIPESELNKRGPMPTSLQAMQLGSGTKCKVEDWDMGRFGPYRKGMVDIDPEGISAWLPADYDDSRYGWTRGANFKLGKCIWAQHGVWDPSDTTNTRFDYFAFKDSGNYHAGKESIEPMEFFQKLYWKPFVLEFINAIRSVQKNAIIYIQPPVNEVPISWSDPSDPKERIFYGPHFYDGLTLITKKWNWFNVDILGLLRGKYSLPVFAVKIGEAAIRKSLVEQLEFLKKEGQEIFGDFPIFISEIGIPYDMDDKSAYKTGDYSSQIRAMDASCHALDVNMLNFTLWNYSPSNNHEWGDNWNREDLSLYSKDHTPNRKERSWMNCCGDNSTGRVLSSNTSERKPVRAQEAFIRPYAIATFGVPLKADFVLNPKPIFTYAFRDYHSEELSNIKHDIQVATELYVPAFHFGIKGGCVSVSDGTYEYDYATQILKWTIETDSNDISKTKSADDIIHEITIQTFACECAHRYHQ